MMYSARTIANEFVRLAESEGTSITQMALQKLVYIAHGWNLGIFGEPLIIDQVQAWTYGPVIPDLYHSVKRFGYLPVTGVLTALPAFIPEDDRRSREVVRAVWKAYGKRRPTELSNITHIEGTPWRQIYDRHRGRLPMHEEIPLESIREYYERLKEERGVRGSKDK